MRETLCLLRAGRRRKTWKTYGRAQVGPMADFAPCPSTNPMGTQTLLLQGHRSCLGTSGANTSLPRQLEKFFPLFSLYTSLALLAPLLAVTQSCARGSRRGLGLLDQPRAHTDLPGPCRDQPRAHTDLPGPCPSQPRAHTDLPGARPAPGPAHRQGSSRKKLLAKCFPGTEVGDGTGTLQHPGC